MTSRFRIPAIILVIALAWVTASSCSRQTATPRKPAVPDSTPTRPPESSTPPAIPARTPVSEVDPSAMLPYLPENSVAVDAATVRAATNRQARLVALLGYGQTSDRLGFERIELAMFNPESPPASATVWTSGPMLGDRAEALQVRDINGDGVAEVLSVQSTGASGQVLYVLSLASSVPVLLRPSGGEFDGRECFGEVGVRLEDINHDGLVEILASYGPAATYTDVYYWDGAKYEFGVTLQDK